MNRTELLTHYESLDQLMDAMNQAAQQGDWEALATLETRSQPHIHTLMTAPFIVLDAADQQRKLSLIQRILHHDARIRALAEPQLDKLGEQLQASGIKRKSTLAYQRAQIGY